MFLLKGKKKRGLIVCASINLFFLFPMQSIVYAGWVLNNPYPASEAKEEIYYTSFNEQPKTLDPAKSYSNNESQFTGQVYEPILQYDYLIRPPQLVPLTALQVPEIRYYDSAGHEVDKKKTSNIARSIYTIHIRPGIFYQPHPAFAKNVAGQYRYHHLPEDYLSKKKINSLADFKYTGTRELKADDYIYEIKRLATPFINSPIYSLMSEHIVGFREFGSQLPPKSSSQYVDLRLYPLKGVRKLDDYTFEIEINGQYPQFLFWLAMPFFAPIPWEAEVFYAQPGMKDNNITLGWYPVGTGPFMISENNPNSQIVLDKNPHYRTVYFPSNGSAEDEKNGYLRHQGQRLPLLKKAVFILEKETIPRWNKFLQGYYDLSGISADSFDQAIQITRGGHAVLTPQMQNKGIRLEQVNEPAIYYLGFNMLDPIVGGSSKRARLLRQAISIAINYDEFIAIFYNGRGQAAQGPIPPGIFGAEENEEGINPYVYTWNGNKPQRRSIEDARKLMRLAGYAGGRNPATGRALILHYDVPSSGSPDEREQLNWMRKQFARIGISLDVRATQYNQFQEKMRNGNAQIFSWGWIADYPDPENFLFLLYGKNGKVKYGGENAANYQNNEYDRLFNLMKNRDNDEERLKLLRQLLTILRRDAPWVWGINSQSFILSQQWVSPLKANTVAYNLLKYMSIDAPLRDELRRIWNKPVLWPVGLFILVLLILLFPFLLAYYQRRREPSPRRKL